MNPPDVIAFASPEILAEEAARLWLETLAARDRKGSPCLAAVSGGRIARNFFAALTAQVRSGKGTLDRVEFFWADERCVPYMDPQSNFRLASETLFEPLGIPLGCTHRIPGELPPENAAAEAERLLLDLAPLGADGQPVLDFVFLGMGEDGHVASLFPNEPQALVESKCPYRLVHSPKPPPLRITLNYGPILAARNVWVLASGAGKRKALDRSLAGSPDTPLGRLLAKRGERASVRIFTDVPR
ncbi:MAG: 6-phosphogluconolactonase [Verrucomicrobiia bacterium]